MPRGRKRKLKHFVPPNWIRESSDEDYEAHGQQQPHHDGQPNEHHNRQVNLLYESKRFILFIKIIQPFIYIYIYINNPNTRNFNNNMFRVYNLNLIFFCRCSCSRPCSYSRRGSRCRR